MKRRIPLWEKAEYKYPCAGDFIPNIVAIYMRMGKSALPWWWSLEEDIFWSATQKVKLWRNFFSVQDIRRLY